MARRLLVVAHGRTGGRSDPAFGDPGPLAPSAEIAESAGIVPPSGRIQRWVAGPEHACGQTAELLGGRPTVLPGLAAPDPGSWRGRTVGEIAAEDPAGLQAWLADPDAAPHGGESLRQALARLARVVGDERWPDGRSILVVTPAAARLLAIHAAGGPPELAFRLDVRFGGRFELSGGDRGWRLLLG
jgi:broad specificity phosphatase PhoE